MQSPRHKALPLIFVAVRDVSIIVKGKTWPRARALGFEGMRFKWDRDRQHWRGPLTLRNLEALNSWPEAELSLEARQAIENFREAARKQREYYRWR